MCKIKILEVGMSYKAGGIETFLVNFLKNFDKEVFQTDVINVFPSAKNESFFKQLKEYGNIYEFPNYRKHPVKFYKKLKELNNNEKYHILHYNMNSASYIFPLIAAKLCGIKIVIAHSHNSMSDKGLIKQLLHSVNRKFIPFFANYYFACSDLAGKWFYSKKIMKSQRFFIINNAIEIDNYKYDERIRTSLRKKLKINEDTFVVGNVGRFKPQKNHKYLVDIFYELQKQYENSRLLLVGDGPLKNEIKSYVEQLGIPDKVVFIGFVNNVSEYMQVFDSFVLPSIYEGLPFVGIEAQASGLPCFFSDTITKYLDLSDSNVFISLDTSVCEWANIILENSKNIDRSCGYKKITEKGFNVKEEVKKVEEIYKKILNV